MTAAQVAALFLGLGLLPLGVVIHRAGRRGLAEARERNWDVSLRMNLKATEIIGLLVMFSAVTAIVGSLVGAVLWGNRGEPRWPW